MVINIEDESKQLQIMPIWRMPFRPFFAAIAIFSCLSLGLWVLKITKGVGHVDLMWHLHEMIMGFAATTVVGFVLTASQTWTGVRTIHGHKLMGLFLLWCSVRVAWFMPTSWAGFAGGLECLLFLLVAVAFGRQVLLAKNWRNGFFIGVFVALGMVNAAYGYLISVGELALAKHLLMIAFFLIAHVVLVVGGRVIPFFSDRGLQRAATDKPAWLELSALISSVLFLVIYLARMDNNTLQAAACAVVIFNVIRWLSWKPWQTYRKPILWSLHIAYAFMTTGFLFIGLDYPGSAALHLIAIGGFGLMILAMISRVSLGHSGRPLELVKGFWVAYVGMIFAALTRVAAQFYPMYYLEFLWLALVGWVVGFGLFVWFYLPILISPRLDGRPG